MWRSIRKQWQPHWHEVITGRLKEYDIQSAEDIQDALKDLLGGTIKEMMEAEMDDHLTSFAPYLSLSAVNTS